MKPLIDLSQASGKTFERAVTCDGYMALHWRDGTASILEAGTYGGQEEVQEACTTDMKPSVFAKELGLCSQEEVDAQDEENSQERERRMIAGAQSILANPRADQFVKELAAQYLDDQRNKAAELPTLLDCCGSIKLDTDSVSTIRAERDNW